MQSIVDFSDVNVELGLTSTAQLSASNTGFRNVANDNSGEINMTQVRRGINFRGGFIDDFAGRNASNYYTTVVGGTGNFPASANLNLEIDAAALTSKASAGNVTIRFYSNGQAQYLLSSNYDSTTKTQDIRNTWLTAGAAGDYTVNMSLDSGTFNGTGSNTTGTDLAMSSDRGWTVFSRTGSGVSNTMTARGNIIIKTAGTEIFRRPYNIVNFTQGN